MPSTAPSPYLSDPDGQEHVLKADGVTLGRAVECDIVILSKRASRQHAQIWAEGRYWFLEDMHSTNGVFLNGERILDRQRLRDGDELTIGEITMTFHDPDVTSRETWLPELEINAAAGVVRVNRKPVELSPKEFALLLYLQQHNGLVCSKEEIAQAVWPEYQPGGVYDYQIENLVRRLRARIEPDPNQPQLLITVRGLGYKLVLAESG